MNAIPSAVDSGELPNTGGDETRGQTASAAGRPTRLLKRPAPEHRQARDHQIEHQIIQDLAAKVAELVPVSLDGPADLAASFEDPAMGDQPGQHRNRILDQFFPKVLLAT